MWQNVRKFLADSLSAVSKPNFEFRMGYALGRTNDEIPSRMVYRSQQLDGVSLLVHSKTVKLIHFWHFSISVYMFFRAHVLEGKSVFLAKVENVGRANKIWNNGRLTKRLHCATCERGEGAETDKVTCAWKETWKTIAEKLRTTPRSIYCNET